jgi:hypothetical protein
VLALADAVDRTNRLAMASELTFFILLIFQFCSANKKNRGTVFG